MADAPILDIRNLRLDRGNTVILDGIDWRVERGEQWVILGPNGSGKTTLLAAITGYIAPTDGKIQLLGKTYGESCWPDLRKKIGLVSSALSNLVTPDETALETIISGRYAMINLWKKPTANDNRNGRAILKLIECAPLTNRSWLFLSQGERQRVLIGRALMAKPKLLILDEPCAGLDPAARDQFLLFLNRLTQQRTTPALILVTHHVEEIVPIFTHTLLLKEGKICASGQLGATLTSRNLSESFGSNMKLQKKTGRYTLTVIHRGTH